jgi:phage terminase small subunit
MGRPRKSTADHERDGTLRHDRHFGRLREPKFSGAPKRPRGLRGEAKKFWDSIVPQLVAKGVAKQIDAPALEVMSLAWAEFKASVSVKAGSDLDDMRRRQLLAAGWQRMWQGVAAKFGLTPSDRAKLEVEMGGDLSNPFEQFMQSSLSNN